MRNNFGRRVAFLVGGACVGLTSAFAYKVSTDASSVYVIKWGASPIAMQVQLPTTTTLSDGNSQSSSVIACMQAWNAVLGTMQFSSQTVAPGAGAHATTNSVNEILMDSTVDGKAFSTGVLAITLSYSRGNDRVEADIVFNTAYTWDSYRGALRQGSEDLQRVAVHELGHVIGLLHPDDFGQTVVAVMNSHESNIDSLQADDIAGGQKLYGAPGVNLSDDNFAAATIATFSGGTLVLTGSNIGAGAEVGEPAPASTAGIHSVWWRWTAPADGSFNASTLGSDFDTVLGVYTGSRVSTLSLVAENDDEETPAQNATPQRKRTSLVTFNATRGVTYYFEVNGWGSAGTLADGYTGSITLNLSFTSIIDPAAAVSRLVNLSVRSRAGSADKTLIMGFVISSGAANQVLVRGLGPLLNQFGVAGYLADPQLNLFTADGVRIDSNDNWNQSLNATFAAVGAVALTAGSKDAALLRSMSTGVYSAQITSDDSTTGIALAEIYDVGKAGARFVNVSARSQAGTGDDILIAGFVLEGGAAKKLLIRGLGPTLTSLGVNGSLADPVLSVFDQAGVELALNDDWGGTPELKTVFTQVGAVAMASDTSKDSALVMTLLPGVYSVHVAGVAGTTGVALVEVYEVP
jgi:hypothetical protein